MKPRVLSRASLLALLLPPLLVISAVTVLPGVEYYYTPPSPSEHRWDFTEKELEKILVDHLKAHPPKDKNGKPINLEGEWHLSLPTLGISYNRSPTVGLILSKEKGD